MMLTLTSRSHSACLKFCVLIEYVCVFGGLALKTQKDLSWFGRICPTSSSRVLRVRILNRVLTIERVVGERYVTGVGFNRLIRHIFLNLVEEW